MSVGVPVERSVCVLLRQGLDVQAVFDGSLLLLNQEVAQGWGGDTARPRACGYHTTPSEDEPTKSQQAPEHQ